MEDLLCKTVTKLVLPAIRVSVAIRLHEEFKYTQSQISDKIGIVQVGVGKYLNGKYSKEVGEIKDYINENQLNEDIIEGIVRGRGLKETEEEIDALCNNSDLLDFATGLLITAK